MAITELQREQRTRGLGSSDAAAVLGFNPWRGPADVRLEKLGLVEPDDTTSELAEIGTALEGGIAELAARRLGVRLVKPTGTYHHESGILFANPDRQIDAPRRGQPVVECKDTGIDEGWGEPGTDEVPPYVLIQVCHQLVCIGAAEAHVARLGRGFNRGLSLYRIERVGETARLCDAMERRLVEWWRAHVINGDPLPDDAPPPTMDTLRRVRREPEAWADVPDDLVRLWRRAKEREKRAKAVADARQRRLIDALGTAEGGRCSLGTVTYLEQTRRECVVKATTCRVLRFKGEK